MGACGNARALPRRAQRLQILMNSYPVRVSARAASGNDDAVPEPPAGSVQQPAQHPAQLPASMS
ncbi:hypothetical protein DN536_38610, partial [Burkholderia multivorans]